MDVNDIDVTYLPDGLGSTGNYFTIDLAVSGEETVDLTLTQNQTVPGQGYSVYEVCGVVPDDLMDGTPGVGYQANVNPGVYNDTNVGSDDPSSFGEVGGEFVLPVELLNFDASASGSSSDLAWSTATETNNSHFEIQRSIDGVTFERIGRVDGAGTIQEEQTYSFVDENAAAVADELFYRLKQVDFNGNSEFSDIRTVHFGENGSKGVKVFPSPAKQGQQVVIQAKDIQTMDVYNIHGRLIDRYEFNDGQSTTSIQTARLSAGMYVIVINNNIHRKLVVE